MADLGRTGEANSIAAGTAPLSRLAWVQSIALFNLRWRMLANGLRSNQGLFELGARGVSLLVYGALGVGMSIALGVSAYSLVSDANWKLVPVLFWGVCFLWQTVPVALASFQQQFDMSGLLRFPMSFSTFFLLYLVFGLSDISTLLGALCCTGILVGVTWARPDLLGWMIAVLAGFSAFNILLVRVILAWVDRWLAQRRTREIVSAVFILFLLSLQLLNPALREDRHPAPGAPTRHAKVERKQADDKEGVIGRVYAAQAWLPPGLVAASIRHAERRHMADAAGTLGVLALYVLAAGGLLQVRLRAEYRGENLGETAVQEVIAERREGWVLDGTGPIAAVMEKELRTMLRSMPLLYSVGAPLFMVLIFGGLIRSNTSGAGHSFTFALPACIAYALLGSSQMIYNTLGAEGTGVQVLFLSPTPVRTVLLAKNLFHALVFGVVALLAGILAGLRLGRPSDLVLAATVAWLLFALLANLAVGNVFSLVMPHRMNLGRLTRQRGSAAGSLLSMFIQMVLLAVGASVFALCSIGSRLWLAVPVFLVLAGVAFAVWMRVLYYSDAMANQRRDLLIQTLAKTE